MDNLEIYYKKAAQQLRSGEALFGKYGALAQNKGVFPSITPIMINRKISTFMSSFMSPVESVK